MKLKLLLAMASSVAVLSALHVTYNVQGGWTGLQQDLFGGRRELTVGFLPVT
jgi:hypothetical protein